MSAADARLTPGALDPGLTAQALLYANGELEAREAIAGDAVGRRRHPVRTIMEALRHSEIGLTMSTYTHVRGSAAQLAGWLSPIWVTKVLTAGKARSGRSRKMV